MSELNDSTSKEPVKTPKDLVKAWSKHCHKLELEIEKLKEELRKYRGY